MINELSKRIITSIVLISLLALTFFYTYILIILLIIISIIAWIEFNGLITKIFNKKNLKNRSIIAVYRLSSLLYLLIFSIVVFDGIAYGITQIGPNSKLNIIFLFLICILSDIGGLIFGRIFKGKRLTKISPNKTISGSIGSIVLSMILVPIFYFTFEEFNNLLNLISLSFVVCIICQLGDLLISYLKRKAKVKDTGDLLPGHGGILDRIDGILFAVPFGLILLKFLQ